MSEESLEVCQEATLCVPPPSATREKEEGEGGENSICISFHRNVGQGFGVSANWEGGGGVGGPSFEHTAEECGCGLQPAAYAILMFP